MALNALISDLVTLFERHPLLNFNFPQSDFLEDNIWSGAVKRARMEGEKKEITFE